MKPHAYPVSVKGVIVHDDQVVLLQNERDEWELPGGKLDLGETPEECVVREIAEELDLTATITGILDTWVYTIHDDQIVLIVTYAVTVDSLDGIKCSHEHKEARVFGVAEVPGLNMPDGYKRSIAEHVRRQGSG